jgi:hypothetical protein
MELNLRRLEKEDLKIINTWWDAWPEWERPPENFLPETALVVESESQMITAAFIYLTNSKVALLEWFISDPNYRESNRQFAIELLITGAEEMLKNMDYKYLFSITSHEKLIKTQQNLGWSKDEKPSHELVKIIN